ncbi:MULTISPECIES: methyltransferase domain-containing protein [unclassified Clostridium]|uniref:class I SAM-dependent methyltransferase n=1 Tax=unclassified Clostridium TaxID=2614128 RepID=UPI00207AC3C3|nr:MULTISPECIES: methyltransferase domain-containing protein [unclassified Clostridium]
MDKDVLECMSKIKDYYLGNSKLNTKEVINILLGEDKSFKQNGDNVLINNNSSLGNFDMEELLRWKNKNNDKYQITSYWPITSHRKFIGKFLILSKKFVRKLLKWYIDPIVEQQNEFNGSVTASINALYNNEVVTQEFIKCVQSNKDLEEKMNKLEEINKELIESNKVLSSKVEKLIVNINENSNKTEELSNKTKELSNKTKQLADVDDRIDEDIDYIRFKLSKINKIEIKENNSEPIVEEIDGEIQKNKENEAAPLSKYGIDYFEFENRFRGIRKDIKNRQTIYLEYFKNKNNVLDIGCGRGEFLELLNENSINAKGIDVCETFIKYCKYRKLDAILEDGVSYLNKINDNSVDGVFMSQVAEHLETEYLIELVSKVYNKLEKGSYFIAETPNPVMLSTFSNSFYIDPSHKNPVHPETFKFILEKAGFKDIQIMFTECSKTEYTLPLLHDESVNNLKEFNNGINHLNDLLFGSQDYAIIAKK